MIKKDIPYSEGTASIGICFDVPRQKETVIIGSSENIKRYFTLGVKQDIDVTTRKLGTLVDEMNALAQADENCRMTDVITAANGLCGVISSGQGNKTAEEFTDVLYAFYDASDYANTLLNYITKALKMKKGLSEDSPKQSIYEYSEFLRVGEETSRELAGRLADGTL